MEHNGQQQEKLTGELSCARSELKRVQEELADERKKSKEAKLEVSGLTRSCRASLTQDRQHEATLTAARKALKDASDELERVRGEREEDTKIRADVENVSAFVAFQGVVP